MPFAQKENVGKVSLYQKYIGDNKFLKIELFDQKHDAALIAFIDPMCLDMDLLGNLVLDSVAFWAKTHIQDDRSRILPYMISDIYKLQKAGKIPKIIGEKIKQEYFRLQELPKKQMATFLLNSNHGLVKDLLPIIYAYLNTPMVQTPYPRALLKPYTK